MRWSDRQTVLRGLDLCFFFFKQKTAYEIGQWLEFRRVLFRSATVNQLENRETPTYNLDETGALFVPPQQLPSPILTDTISTLDAL